MTIATGFVCSGGIVLGADSLYSGRSSRHGDKLWNFDFQGKKLRGCGFAMVGAGAGPVIWSARDKLKSVSPKGPTVEAIADALEAALAAFYERHAKTLESAPLELIIAIHTPDKCGLFLSESSPILGPVPRFACIGSNGSILGSWIGQRFASQYTNLVEGQAIVSYLLEAVKQYDPEAGGRSLIAVVTATDRPFVLLGDGQSHRYYRYINFMSSRAFRLALSAVDKKVSDADFRESLSFFLEDIQEGREEIWPPAQPPKKEGE